MYAHCTSGCGVLFRYVSRCWVYWVTVIKKKHLLTLNKWVPDKASAHLITLLGEWNKRYSDLCRKHATQQRFTITHNQYVTLKCVHQIDVKDVAFIWLVLLSRTRRTPGFLLGLSPSPASRVYCAPPQRCWLRSVELSAQEDEVCVHHPLRQRTALQLPASISVQLLQNLQGTVSHWRWMPQDLKLSRLRAFVCFLYIREKERKEKAFRSSTKHHKWK